MEFSQEGLESFGSPGYMEDTGLPAIIRDAQVNTIWEGTTNILSLDVIRVISHEPTILKTFGNDVLDRIKGNTIQQLDTHCKQIQEIVTSIIKFAPSSVAVAEFSARDLAFTIARIYAASLLLEQANWSKSPEDIFTVQFWCTQRPLSSLDLAPRTAELQSLVNKVARL